MPFSAHPLVAMIQARSNQAKHNPVPVLYLAGAGIAALAGYYLYTKTTATVSVEGEEGEEDLPEEDLVVEGDSVSYEDQQLQDLPEDDVVAAEESEGDEKKDRPKKKAKNKAKGGKTHGKKQGHREQKGNKRQGGKAGAPKLTPSVASGGVKFKPSTPQVRAGVGQTGPSSRSPVKR